MKFNNKIYNEKINNKKKNKENHLPVTKANANVVQTFNLSTNELLSILPNESLCLSLNLRNLSILPDIRRFDRLVYINCSYNNLTELPEWLFFELKHLLSFSCNHNQLITLPFLPTNALLRDLSCSGNLLVELPPFSRNLISVDCSINQIKTLPPLIHALQLRDFICCKNKLQWIPGLIKNTNLCMLFCSYNQLKRLPVLPDSVKQVNYFGNPILADILLPITRFEEWRRNVHILHTFAETFFAIKFKNKFHQWLWKSREKSIQLKYHPCHLNLFINEDENTMQDFLDSW